MKKKTNTEKDEALTLLEIFKAQATKKMQLGSTHTAANYKTCIRKLANFLQADAAGFSIRHVTPQWVESWVRHLTSLHPGHPETVDFYFRNSRAMYNLALASLNDKQGCATSPFRGIKIKKHQPSKRALTAEETRRLMATEFRERLKPALRKTLDVLLFILYARGMVFRDVYNLRWEMIDKGHIRYSRSKTGSPVEVGIMPETREIMERYRRKDSPFVFAFLHSHTGQSRTISEEAALRRINYHASRIGKLAELSLPLTTYVMRHTWATLMLEIGKPVELISQCLGHSNIRTTQIYLSRISSGKVDAEVNDMFNRTLREDDSVHLQKGKQKNTKKEADGSHSHTRRKRVSDTDKETKTPKNTRYSKEKRKKHARKEKIFPFLAKKEKIVVNLYSSIPFPVAKIHTSRRKTNFSTPFFGHRDHRFFLKHLKSTFIPLTIKLIHLCLSIL